MESLRGTIQSKCSAVLVLCSFSLRHMGEALPLLPLLVFMQSSRKQRAPWGFPTCLLIQFPLQLITWFGIKLFAFYGDTARDSTSALRYCRHVCMSVAGSFAVGIVASPPHAKKAPCVLRCRKERLPRGSPTSAKRMLQTQARSGITSVCML